MSSRGFLVRISDESADDFNRRQPLSPNIVVSRSDYFAAIEDGGK